MAHGLATADLQHQTRRFAGVNTIKVVCSLLSISLLLSNNHSSIISKVAALEDKMDEDTFLAIRALHDAFELKKSGLRHHHPAGKTMAEDTFLAIRALLHRDAAFDYVGGDSQEEEHLAASKSNTNIASFTHKEISSAGLYHLDTTPSSLLSGKNAAILAVALMMVVRTRRRRLSFDKTTPKKPRLDISVPDLLERGHVVISNYQRSPTAQHDVFRRRCSRPLI